MELADYQLADLLSIAGATIGIIIAGGVLLQCMSTKYIGVFDRYRALTTEFRGANLSDQRRGSLKQQIMCYSKQITFLNYASLAVVLAVLCFLVVVATASLSVMFPRTMAFRFIGTAGLFAGLLCNAVGAGLFLFETLLQRATITKELSDFKDLPYFEEALH